LSDFTDSIIPSNFWQIGYASAPKICLAHQYETCV
jgi:hypothetical protein